MRIAILFILSLIQITSLKSQSIEIQKIEGYLEKLEGKGFSGAILVGNKDKILLKDGYGSACVNDGIENNSSTVFDIGSVTKQFTAAAILKLEMQGRLSVNDKLLDYFNDIPSDKRDINIHHLLTHSSGLPPAIGDDYEAVSTKKFVEDAFAEDLLFEPGSSYEYSNVGYSLLGIIVEQLSKQSYEDYLYDNLWKPAGMENTGYNRPDFTKENMAVGYSKSGKEWGRPIDKKWNDDGPYWHLKANGGVLSTVEDMYLWHLALLSPGILSDTALKKYFEPYVQEGEGSDSYYAYGWAMYTTSRGSTLAAHNGGNGIFFADFWRYLDDDLVIIVMSNRSGRNAERLAQQLGAIYFVPDYKPKIVENAEGNFSENEISELVNTLMSVFKSDQAKDWETFLTTYASNEFLNMAPMDTHLKYFAQFHNDFKDSEVDGLTEHDGEITLELKTPDGNHTVMMNILKTDAGLKIEGLMID